jgi:choline kinase
MKAVIIAAGMGSRIWNRTDNRPKTLLPCGQGTILSTIIDNFRQTGINNFIIVIGYQSEYVRSYVEENIPADINIEFVENLQWEKGNGISVKVVEPLTGSERFMLSMSDHIVAVSALKRIVQSDAKENLLLVDPDGKDVFDVDDATKVKLDGTAIKEIGKELAEYDGMDCGIFKLKKDYFTAMNKALADGKDSISAAIGHLIVANNMSAVFLEPGEKWYDIDTPEAYQHFLAQSGRE